MLKKVFIFGAFTILLMSDGWVEEKVASNGIKINLLQKGEGHPVFLLHGWPEYWFTWRKNIPFLSKSFKVVAPDLRGFGGSEKPGKPVVELYSLNQFVEDIKGLADKIGLDQFAVVSHDLGANIAQKLARMYPDRVSALFFFNCPYPGIGERWGKGKSLPEVWYQWFHQLPLATDLVGYNRETCKTYLRFFLERWSYRENVFEEDLERFVDNYMKPGNIQGGFNWYIASKNNRLKLIEEGSPDLPRIETVSKFFWGEKDPVIKVEWADRLDKYFKNFDFEVAKNAGHFVHYEKPEKSNEKIKRFLNKVLEKN